MHLHFFFSYLKSDWSFAWNVRNHARWRSFLIASANRPFLCVSCERGSRWIEIRNSHAASLGLFLSEEWFEFCMIVLFENLHGNAAVLCNYWRMQQWECGDARVWQIFLWKRSEPILRELQPAYGQFWSLSSYAGSLLSSYISSYSMKRFWNELRW